MIQEISIYCFCVENQPKLTETSYPPMTPQNYPVCLLKKLLQKCAQNVSKMPICTLKTQYFQPNPWPKITKKIFVGERSDAKVGERSEAWQNGGKWGEKGEKKGKSLF